MDRLPVYLLSVVCVWGGGVMRSHAQSESEGSTFVSSSWWLNRKISYSKGVGAEGWGEDRINEFVIMHVAIRK